MGINYIIGVNDQDVALGNGNFDSSVDLYDKYIPRNVSGLWAWGNTGNLSIGAKTTPTQIDSFNDWNLSNSTLINACNILNKDGSRYIIGINYYGDTGINSNTGVVSTLQKADNYKWSQLGYTGGVKIDGTLWMWGDNGNGECCQPTTTSAFSSPIQVGTLTNWKSITYGPLAIKTDGTLWAWGWNANGVCCQPTTTLAFSSPVQIGTLTNWKQASTGDGVSAAVKTDGTLWAWGWNANGVCCQPTTTLAFSSPVQIGTSTNWKQVSCAQLGVLAIKTDGTLWAWGSNYYGQLGDGTTVTKSSPIQIGTSTNWKQVSCDGWSTAAIKTDGTLWAWGWNYYGQLGLGDKVDRNSPVQVGTSTNWKQVSISSRSTIATKVDDILDYVQ